MNLAEEFLNLKSEKKHLVQIELCENALAVLNAYFAETGKIEYIESVVGTNQRVDSELPNDALLAAKQGENLYDVEYRYKEPITAMQDNDLTFPENIEFAFYAIYNLFQKYALKIKIDDWLIVNQALSAEKNKEKWKDLLKDAIEKVK